MAGNKIGGQKAAATNKAKYGKDFYVRIGKVGGANGRTGGFYADRQLAREAGRKGGTNSKRGPAKIKPRREVMKKTSRFSDEHRAKLSAAAKARWERQRLLGDDWGFLTDVSDEAVMGIELPRRGWRFWRRTGD